ncbi:hypothetical protein P3S67_027308 [Capsicum chacoense]
MWMTDMCHPKLIVFSSLFLSTGNELPLNFPSGTSQLNEGSVGIISITREDWFLQQIHQWQKSKMREYLKFQMCRKVEVIVNLYI